MKRWVSPEQERFRNIFEGTLLLAVVVFVCLLLFVTGMVWGQMGRDCKFMEYKEVTPAPYCSMHVQDAP